MASDMLLVAAGASAACGSAVLRLAWSRPRRSIPWNSAGWGLLTLGTGLGWLAAGAWGSTIAALAGMSAALLLLGHAAATAPAAGNTRASNRRAGALPQAGEPWRIGRRIMTFLLVVLAALIVSVGLGIAARMLLVWSGAGEANTNVAGFFVMPLGWALLAFALLMEPRRARQWRLLAACAVPGVLATIVGLAA